MKTFDDIFELHITVKGEDSKCRVIYHAQAKTWLVILITILLIVHTTIGVLAALIAYLRYDDIRKRFKSASRELGGERVL